jgi:hypothetical protein
MKYPMILEALARLIQREMGGGDRYPEGDILERSVGTIKSGGGLSDKLTNSNSTANSQFAAAGLPVISPGPERRVSFQIDRLKADVYTVELNILNPPAGSTANPILLGTEADVIFSVDGKQSVRRVSVNQGIRVCGQADAISVKVRDNSVAAVLGRTPLTVEYQVVIVVSRGIRPDLQQPPTLAPVGPTDPNGFLLTPAQLTLAPAGSLDINIPVGVGIISTNTTVIDQAFAPIPEAGAAVAYLANLTVLREFDPRVAPWVPIVPGTNQVRIRNNTVGQTIQFSIMYGIDG